jgi:hypothetical protein
MHAIQPVTCVKSALQKVKVKCYACWAVTNNGAHDTMQNSAPSSGNEDTSPSPNPDALSDYHHHQVLLPLPAPLYKQVSELAQCIANGYVFSSDTLTKEELDHLRSQANWQNIAQLQSFIAAAFKRRANGQPVVKHLAPKLVRTNRTSIILMLLTYAVKNYPKPPATTTTYTFEQACQYIGLPAPNPTKAVQQRDPELEQWSGNGRPAKKKKRSSTN